MDNQRLFLYLALGFVSLLLYQAWMLDYHAPEPAPTTQSATAGADTPAAVAGSDGLPTATSEAAIAASTVDATLTAPAVTVKTDVMEATISTQGATITRVALLKYPLEIDTPNVPLELMSNEPGRYLVLQSGLQSGQGMPSPTHKETFRVAAESYTLADGQDSVTIPFEWQGENGVKVVKSLTFRRDSYVVDIDYAIENAGTAAWPVNQYRQLKRKPATKDEKQQFVNTYIGGVLSSSEDNYQKINFGDMRKENLNSEIAGGWVAMIQHYFAAALIPAQETATNTAYTRYLADEDRYLIGLVSESASIPAGGQGSFSTKAFIGPKIQDRLKAAAPNLELTVDYGWLTILAQPLFWLLKTIYGFIGNWGWAIVLVTVIIKAAFYKLSEASYKSMAKMKLLQPKLQSLKERYGDDRAAMGQATMELYKKEKVNPLGGCLPMIIQIPVFIALYWALLESVELRQAPWILWIKDLSVRDPYFILPVIMAATMFLQQKLNPAPVDPIQQKVMQFLPLIFGVFFAMFPAGLVLYWVANNTLSIAQQYYITRHVIGDTPDPNRHKKSQQQKGNKSKDKGAGEKGA